MDTRQAFNGVAGFYDGPFGNNELIQRMRDQLLQAVQHAITPGSRLLDLGCGTGIDAVALASRGYRVVAVDWSPAMVDRTLARAAASGMQDRVQSRVVGIHELDRLAGERFDGIYSDMGPFNCIPDLETASCSCAGLLAPGGSLVVTVMGRLCPWEIAYFAARGNARRAALRATRGVVPAPLRGGVVWTRYFTPRDFTRACMPWFQVKSYRGLGVVVPPPYMLALHQRLRTLAPFIEALDDAIGGMPVGRELGDHFLMVLTRRGVMKIEE